MIYFTQAAFVTGFVIAVGYIAALIAVRAWRWLRRDHLVTTLRRDNAALDRENQRLAGQLMAARKWNNIVLLHNDSRGDAA